MGNSPSIKVICTEKIKEFNVGETLVVHFGKANQMLKTGRWILDDNKAEIMAKWEKRYGRG